MPLSPSLNPLLLVFLFVGGCEQFLSLQFFLESMFGLLTRGWSIPHP